MADHTKWNQDRSYLPASTRQRILKRDRYQCQRCGTRAGPFEVNHRLPAAFGGTDDDENLETLCIYCHESETRAQRIEGIRRRNARRRLPQKPHPGLKL